MHVRARHAHEKKLATTKKTNAPPAGANLICASFLLSVITCFRTAATASKLLCHVLESSSLIVTLLHTKEKEKLRVSQHHRVAKEIVKDGVNARTEFV